MKGKLFCVVAIGLGLLAVSSCQQIGHSKLPEKLTVTVWPRDTTPKVDYPELTDSRIRPARLENFGVSKRRYGAAFSGGGTRSAAATLGQIRMMKTLGWEDRFHYYSAISGGSWTAIPYTFIPDDPEGDLPGDAGFLGDHVEPENLDGDKLKERNGTQMRGIASSDVKSRMIKHWILLQGDETYSQVLNDIFLKKSGLAEPRFFAFDKPSAKLAATPGQLDEKNSRFYVANPDKPYLIASGTVDNRNGDGANGVAELYPIEMTPHYVGFSSSWKSPDGEKEFGGYYLAAQAYDTKFQTLQSEDTLHVRWKKPGQRFTISDMMAVSGAAPSATVYGMKSTLGKVLKNLGLPEIRHGNIRDYEFVAEEVSEAFPHGDGGNLEFTAVRPLLARGVNRIIAFVNSSKRLGGVHFLNEEALSCLKPQSAEAIVAGTLIDPDVSSLFTRVSKKPAPVFKGGDQKLAELYAGLLDRKKRGRPLVWCDTYEVETNEKFGIVPMADVRIVWIYLDGAKDWVDALPEGGALAAKLHKHPDVSKLIPARFRRFPNYRTFAEQINLTDLQVIDISKRQTNALAHFTGWVVDECSEEIASFLELE